MSGHQHKAPNLSVHELKEKNSRQIISWSEDEKVVELYLKHDDEEESRHEEVQESDPVEVSGDRNEKIDKRNIDKFDNDIQILLKFGAIKKETSTENATAEELKALILDRAQQPEKQVGLHQCPECPYSTNLKNHLKLHSVRHKVQDEVGWYSCPDCPYETYRKDVLMRHAKIHSLVLKCPECCYETSRRASFYKHQKKHMTKDKSHSCPLCSYKTHSNGNLKRHCQRSHNCDPKNPKQIEIFKCTECPFESGYKYDMTRHRLTHLSKCLQCPNCAYKTSSKANLKRHQLRHLGENAEEWRRCPECSYKTPYKEVLQRHIVSHKTADEIQWFECSQCSYKAVHKANLTRHQKKHKETREIE